MLTDRAGSPPAVYHAIGVIDDLAAHQARVGLGTKRPEGLMRSSCLSGQVKASSSMTGDDVVRTASATASWLMHSSCWVDTTIVSMPTRRSLS